MYQISGAWYATIFKMFKIKVVLKHLELYVIKVKLNW